jgi:hypothetical protein
MGSDRISKAVCISQARPLTGCERETRMTESARQSTILKNNTYKLRMTGHQQLGCTVSVNINPHPRDHIGQNMVTTIVTDIKYNHILSDVGRSYNIIKISLCQMLMTYILRQNQRYAISEILLDISIVITYKLKRSGCNNQ